MDKHWWLQCISLYFTVEAYRACRDATRSSCLSSPKWMARKLAMQKYSILYTSEPGFFFIQFAASKHCSVSFPHGGASPGNHRSTEYDAFGPCPDPVWCVYSELSIYSFSFKMWTPPTDKFNRIRCWILETGRIPGFAIWNGCFHWQCIIWSI